MLKIGTPLVAPLRSCFRATLRAQSTNLRTGNSDAEKGHAYFIATPIGNLGDVTLRAIDILGSVDVICAEDTRHTKKLLQHLNISPKMLVAHHEHNAVNSAAGLVDLLRGGKSVALVSDAGTPGISDPGAEVAAACAKSNIPVHPIPGPSAVVSALSVCGFPSSTFTFVGFLPVKGRARRQKLEEIREIRHKVVLYEAPHRIIDTMMALKELNSDRKVCICRELTKVHEEIKHGSVGDMLLWLEQSQSQAATGSGRIRGEFCLVLGPVEENSEDMKQDATKQALSYLENLRRDGVSRSEAVRMTASNCNLPKSVVYKLALDMFNWSEGSR